MTISYHLLIVEDSADDAELMLYALRDATFQFTSIRVETETEYDAALAATLPDVILCDYQLPRFSTDRALQILNQKQLDIPFIVVSHHIGEDAAVTAMHNGASDYLLKNRLGRLANAIEAAVERRISRQQKAIAEKALHTSEAMKRGILNSLSTCIAVLDGQGIIVATNKAWEDLGDVLGRLYKQRAAVGTNYLELLQMATDGGDSRAERALNGVRSVINRETNFVSVEYEIAVSEGTRWFVARTMPLADSIDGAVISHEDITDRMLAHHALGEANKRLQVLSKRVLSIQEEERRSVSRELHDDIGQSMTALKIGLHRVAQRTSDGTNDDHQIILAECLSIADITLDKLRDLSLQLRPPQLDQLGLEDALNWLSDHQRRATGVDIDCQFSGLVGRLPAVLESVCYRIAQEALNNATRHATAKHIRIRIELSDRLLRLVISDDGVGFDMETARKKALKSGSLGLISMEERAQLAGGRLQVRTVTGAGTAVEAIFAISNPGTPITGSSADLRATGTP